MPTDPKTMPAEPKPWYLSKGVWGGLLAIVLPLVSAAFPALKLVDPNTAADTIVRVLEVVGPVAGGLLAIMGRITADAPISGTKLAQRWHARQSAEQAAATPAGIMGLPLETILNELPIVIAAINELGHAAAPPPAQERPAMNSQGPQLLAAGA